MPRTVTTTYYSFHELEPEAQDRAVENLAFSSESWTQYDSDAAARIALAVFCEALQTDVDHAVMTPHLDLSFAQGAGFSVTGRVTFQGVEYDLMPDYASGLRNHYVHENTVRVEYMGDDEHSQYDEVPGEVTERFREAMRRGFRAAQHYYEGQTSPVAIRYRLEQEYISPEFLEDGTVA